MIRAIIFDMDGTITKPCIDWKRLRERIGAAPGRTIIDHIESLDPAAAERANRILLDTEMDACAGSELNEGVPEVLGMLREQGIPTALVTNNHEEGMRVVLRKHGLAFDVALSRDDGILKPSADLIRKALEALAVEPAETLSIGDGRYDLDASAEAGVPFLYLTHGRPTLDHQPSVASMAEVPDWLREHGDLRGGQAAAPRA
jgi:HAD superfamily hydrolase (TIGR01549 family)